MRKSLILCSLFFGFLSVAAAHAQPTLTKTFLPSTIGPGSLSTITFTVTNGSAAPVTELAFIDTLPVVPGAMTIADPANASTDCDLGSAGSLIAPAGGTSITLDDAQIGGFQSCTISVDVTAATPGVHTNPAVTLSSSAGSSMSGPVDLTVVTTLPAFAKSFAPSAIALGSRSTLTFTMDNTANASRVGSLDFTDIFPDGMVIADPANAATDCISASAPNTTVLATPGSSVITLDANGSTLFPGFEVLPIGATCTVTVDVMGTGAGFLENVSGGLLADFTSAGGASDTLEVTVARLALQKSFIDDPLPAGGNVTLDFVINNFDRLESATGIAFTDDLTTLVPSLAGLTFSSLLSNDCGGSVSGVGGTTIGFSGGTLGAEGSCTISAGLSVPAGAVPGAYTNTTSAITGTLGGSPVVGNMASDDLFISPAPLLTKEFMGDPVNPGDTVVLEFTVTNTSTTSSATDIAFQDRFDTIMPTASATPGNGCCGAGSTCTFTPLFNPPPPSDVTPATLSISGGILAPAGMAGDSCTFSITLDVSAGAAPGLYPNTTSEITATVDGATRTGDPAGDTLTVISAPILTKSFIDDPAVPGGTVTLDFVLEYPADASGDATDITFTDDLASLMPAIAGLTATGLPLTEACDPDGVGSAPGTGTLGGSAGDTLLTFMGGVLSPGESCTISVTLDVPLGATPGAHTNTTSGVAATVGGVTATSAPASDDLMIAGLTFTKEFLSNPVIPGDMTTLRFTIDNVHPTEDATISLFTDNLGDALTGLAAIDEPSVNTCGGTLIGPSFLIYTGGGVLSGESCTIEIDVLVPGGAADGDYINTTSNLSADQGGPVVINPATDILTVSSNLLQLTKEFTDDPVSPGGNVTLEFILTNLDNGQAASAIAFTDNLGAALTDLTFDSVLVDTCGGTVSGTGTDLITVSDVALAAAGVCTLRVSTSVPADAAENVYTNTTSVLTGMIGGFPVSGDPATDNLEIIPLQLFSKSFDGPTTAGGTATLTFTIINPGEAAVSNLSFSDNLDDVISGLIATSLPAEPCGVGSSITGTSFLAFADGSLPPLGGMCSFDVEVLVPGTATEGSFPNVTSDLFRSGLTVADPATADLVIEPPPTFAKVFSPDAILAGGVSTLRFTVDNSVSVLAAGNLDFTDNLPAGVVITTPSVTANACGGTLAAVAGTGVISLTGGSVGAGATCTADVDVTSITTGMHVNLTGDLTSSSGNSGTATDTLTVNPSADLSVTKTDGVTSATPGGSVTYTIVVANAGPSADPAATLSDTFPSPPLSCTYTSVAAGGATGNTAAGAGNLAETLSLPAGSSVTYTASCAIDSNATGTLSNTASVTASVTDTVPGNNSATDGDTVLVPSADLSITKSDGVTSAVPGQTMLTYTIVASNGGLSDDPSVSVTDTLPAELTCAFTSVAAGGAAGNTPGALGDISDTLSMPTGSSATYTVTCVIDEAATGTLSNTATISGSVTDPEPANNSATDDDTVLEPETDLSITKSDSPDPVIAGEDLTYTITVTNNGPSTSSGSTVTDVLPAGVAFSSSADCSEAGGTVTCAIGALDVGMNQVVTFVVTVDQGPAAVIDNTATVSANETDPVPGNNSAMASTTVNPQPGFTKSFDPVEILAGETSVLTFTIDNSTSTVEASALDFTDNLPAGVLIAMPANASTTCTGGTLTAMPGTSVITYSGGTVDAGSTCTLSVDVTSEVAGMHVNLTGDLTSSLGNSGTATATLTVTDPGAPELTALITPAGPLAECDTVRRPITAIQVTIEDDLTSILNADDLASYLLVGTGPDGDFTTTDCAGGVAGDDVEITPLSLSLLNVGPLSVEVALLLPETDGLYRFLVCDTITDSAGNALDGDGDMKPGGDFVLSVFRADPLNLFENGHFDDCPVSLDPWMPMATPPNTIQAGTPGADDVGASPLSASAHVAHSADPSSTLGQCVPVSSGVTYDLEASIRFDPPMGAVANFSRTCEFFAEDLCAGASLGMSSAISLVEDEGGAWISSIEPVVAPVGASSALCDFGVSRVGDDPNFDVFLDALFLGGEGLIFADGFESGDTSAWSSTNP